MHTKILVEITSQRQDNHCGRALAKQADREKVLRSHRPAVLGRPADIAKPCPLLYVDLSRSMDTPVDSFSQLCRETIGEYVYALVDPRAGGSTLDRVFYVGKGSGNRCHAHAHAEERLEEIDDERLKLSTIREIRQATGAPPPVFVVAHSLTEEEAFRLEAILIATLDHRPLTNAVRGQGDRDVWLPAEEIDARYAAPVSRSAIEGTVLFVSLNGGSALPPYPRIKADADTLKRRTLGWWPISAKNAARVDIVVGVYRGLTRCAFEVAKDESGRSVFAVRAPTKERGRSRVAFEGALLKKWPHLLRQVIGDDGIVLTVFPSRNACRLV